jgi:hypothetical protein
MEMNLEEFERLGPDRRKRKKKKNKTNFIYGNFMQHDRCK